MMVMSHPTGNANVRQAALALHEAGQLGEFWTCLAPSRNNWWVNCLPTRIATQVLRRSVPKEIRQKTRTMPGLEMGRLFTGALGLRRLSRHETGFFSIDAVYRKLDQRVSERLASSPRSMFCGAYAYEDGALETFRACRTRGDKCLYDLPIGYWRVWQTLLAEERDLEPEWASTLQEASDTDEKLARKDEELRLADRVFVASSFTRRTIEAAPFFPPRVDVIPYGAPPVIDSVPERRKGRRLRVIFAGSLTQRKGISYLLKAVKSLQHHVELTLLGTKPPHPCPPLDRALSAHRWISSLPHQAVLREMQRHDVLVLPSLFEGFGLVIVEAMSQGIPVITTPHTAGPDIIESGQNGFLVPIRSSEMLTSQLGELASDQRLLANMKENARATAAKLNWSNYRMKLGCLVKECMAPEFCVKSSQ